MTNTEIIKDIIRNVTRANEVEINDNTDLIKDLGMDSISVISLALEIEKVFNIQTPDEIVTLDIMGRFSRLVELIDTILKEQANK